MNDLRQGDMFGPATDIQLRDEAFRRIEAARKGEGKVWREDAIIMVRAYLRGFVGPMEDIRDQLTARGLRPPHNVKACWSELCNELIKRGYIAWTGRWTHTKRPISKHRRVLVYLVL